MVLEKDFKETIVNIKNEIINTQTQILSDANGRLINLYFKLGKILNDNSKWGDKFIEKLEVELKLDFPNTKGFSARNLRRMKRFYLEYKDEEILPPAVAKLPWTHNIMLLEKIKDKEKRFWYANEAANCNWSKVVLDNQIDMNLYERKALADKKNNFKNTLVESQSDLANDLQKDPYIFNLPFLKEKYVEKELEESMVERIRNVLLELGNGFSFIGNQYKITVGNEDYFIDMLFYHLKLHCYIVVELKTIPFKPEFIGQLNFYLTALDEQVKDKMDAPTIGLLLCKSKDKLTVEYSLKGINKPIGVSSYEISKYLPKDILEVLPTEEDINLHVPTHKFHHLVFYNHHNYFLQVLQDVQALYSCLMNPMMLAKLELEPYFYKQKILFLSYYPL